MCTYNTCYMSFDEAERGSMEAGKIADMVILSGNLYETDVTKLDTLKAEQNPVEQVLRGIVRK